MTDGQLAEILTERNQDRMTEWMSGRPRSPLRDETRSENGVSEPVWPVDDPVLGYLS